jgi:hypothetical protein
MAIQSGTLLYYVSQNGRIETVTAKADEQSGRVEIEHSDGRLNTVNAFNIFRTNVAANIASQNRASIPSKSRIEYPQFFRDLKG